MRNIEPNYRYFMEAMANKKPARMPIYEHHIDPGFIAKVIQQPMCELIDGNISDKKKYFKNFVGFWERCGYDIVTFERGIPDVCPGSGCLRIHAEPILRTVEDVENYPWDKIEDLYFQANAPYFELFADEVLKRDNIRAVGGPGYGIFETVQDLVDYTEMCYMMYDDMELLSLIFEKVRNLYERIWGRFLRDYAEPYCVCRMGDDLGFKGATLIPHDIIKDEIIPGYKKIVEMSHQSGRPFILHSCGNIFPIMEDLIATGIDAKHSNEDDIAPFHQWVENYGERICNLGGIDMNILCLDSPEVIQQKVRKTIEENINFGGFGIGCGNSIPDYVPEEGFFAMNKAANEFRMKQEW